jgi:hypothetical protein
MNDEELFDAIHSRKAAKKFTRPIERNQSLSNKHAKSSLSPYLSLSPKLTRGGKSLEQA